MKMSQQHYTALNDVLTWRRDVRHFRPDPISVEQLNILRTAIDRAPSVGNARPWRVLRVMDAGLRAQVRDEFERCNAAAAQDYEADQQSKYLKLKLAGLDNAPEQLAIFTDTDPAAGHGLGRKTMASTLEQSTAMAIHTLWLTAHSLNLGVGMLSILEPARIEAMFAVPETWRFSAYLCLGHPEFEDDTPLLHRKEWQANSETEWQDR